MCSSCSRSNKIHPLLIIDEAQCLSNDILVELRQLLNFQYDSETCMSILLCGQEELLARLRLSFLESLANSVTTTVVMKPLLPEETASYLEERLKHSGARADLFSPPAVRAIHNASHGIMRSINALASAAIQKAWRAKAEIVESDFIATDDWVSQTAIVSVAMSSGLKVGNLIGFPAFFIAAALH